MRRPLSILLVALFFLAPLCALFPAGADAQLPACCRRHGAHHCAMMTAGTELPVTGTHQLTSPNRCPLYGTGTLAVTPAFAIFFAPRADNAGVDVVTPARSSSPTHQAPRIVLSRGPPLAG